jgi:hypothetical protein
MKDARVDADAGENEGIGCAVQPIGHGPKFAATLGWC